MPGDWGNEQDCALFLQHSQGSSVRATDETTAWCCSASTTMMASTLPNPAS